MMKRGARMTAIMLVLVGGQTPPMDRLTVLRPLVGRWQGTSAGQPREGISGA